MDFSVAPYCVLLGAFTSKLSLDCTENNLRMHLAFFSLGPLHYLQNPQIRKNTNFALKLGPTTLFTHLKLFYYSIFINKFSIFNNKCTFGYNVFSSMFAFVLSHTFCVGPVHYSWDLQLLFSAKTTLKLGLMALFTHLKIILLQCFQFSAISGI